MNTMSLEFPMLTLASKIASDVEATSDFSCENFYQTNLSLTSDQATALCTDSANFTFTDPFQTAVALTNSYLYQGTFNQFYFTEFIDKASMPI